MVECAWEHLAPGHIVVNTNGSLHGEKGNWGEVAREEYGYVMRAQRGCSRYKTINLVELHAVKEGLLLVKQLKATKVILYTDSENMLRYVRGGTIPWRGTLVMGEI